MTTLSPKPKKRFPSLYFIPVILIPILVGLAYYLFFESEQPVIELSMSNEFIGVQKALSLKAEDQKSGIKSVSLTITQNDKSHVLFEERVQRTGYTGTVGKPIVEKDIVLSPAELKLTDGEATLTLEVFDFSARSYLKGNNSKITRTVTIDTKPPKIRIIHSERYINPGGTGIVIYRLDDLEATSGLIVNDHYHPGFVVGDGRDDIFIAYFGLPYDTESITTSIVQAQDQAGNKTTLPFSSIFKKKTYRQDRINVGNSFLQKKVPEFEQYYPEMSGDLVDKYLFTNNEVRTRNNAQIKELCGSPHPSRLWEKRFLRMAGQSRAGYADKRTYYYGNKAIDRQVHLGIDIASTKNAEVKAAAAGIVTFADYLGIYGNMVMLDHGQGVFSLYSHLSQINVAISDQIESGVVLGRTGTSGMAGGDHLHFSVLINGVFVNPLEWWDQNWINVTIEDPLTESKF
ncbi:MAG: M23 family metallopeptidase [Desulfobulbaceae bacterium]|nr:MAG: M23 family metallopeptidase [Desulfobulbaceae bacterium]